MMIAVRILDLDCIGVYDVWEILIIWENSYGLKS